jgi:transketolase
VVPKTLTDNDIEIGHAPGRLGWPVELLQTKALQIRRDIITLLAKSQTGHSGGPLSSADFGTALFFSELNIDPKNPKWPERDFWHFSIGHITPLIYSLMAERGYFPLRDLMKFRAFDGHAQGHPSAHDTPGIEVSAGSLGQGLSVCNGVAMASRFDKNPRRIYCVMGDGEQQEGQIWEAAMFAAHYKLDSLCGLLDYNRKQIDGDVEDIIGVKPLADKWRAFNWNVIECNGHDMPDILRALKAAREFKGRPSLVLAHTVMGQGVSFMADDYHWHGKPPKMDQAEVALKELGTSYAEWSARLLAN